ncbi:MAG: substrate-binding domain-containing protein [Candidatus Dormibacteria bacterium]
METTILNRRVRHVGKKTVVVALAVGIGVASMLGTGCGSSSSSSSKKTYTIGFSDSYIGNSWRKTMVSAWEDVAAQAERQGMISGYTVDVSAENTAASQISDLDSLILKHVNAIDIDAADPSALNPTIQKACAAGIKVVVFDSLASAPCEYNLEDSFTAWGNYEADGVLSAIHDTGNIIIVQGVVGSEPNDVDMSVWKADVAKYPNVHIVATVVGEQDATTAQQAIEAVLPSLPTVAGVIIGEGSSGVVAAFQAQNRPVPVVDFDTTGTTLALWESLGGASYATSGSLTDPGQSSAAFWETLALLNGTKVDGKAIPKMLTFPLVIITDATFQAWYSVTPVTATAAWLWTQAEAMDGIAANLKGQTAAAPPVPTSAI